MKDGMPAPSLEGIVEADETYAPESFKGNHSSDGFRMPRRSRSRGKQVGIRGVSHQQVSIVCGTDRSNKSTMKITGRGRINEIDLSTALTGVLNDTNVLVTDKHPSYHVPQLSFKSLYLLKVDINLVLFCVPNKK